MGVVVALICYVHVTNKMMKFKVFHGWVCYYKIIVDVVYFGSDLGEKNRVSLVLNIGVVHTWLKLDKKWKIEFYQ